MYYIPENIDVSTLDLTAEKLAKMIDHTELHAYATLKNIKELCDEAMEYNFGAVCINPTHVQFANNYLEGSEVEVCTVIGFPLGANTSEIKAAEAKLALDQGATEIDMVINIQKVRDGDWEGVGQDIGMVHDEVKERGILKVILETGYLTRDQVIRACKVSVEAGTDFVKTSTGFGVMGASYDHVKLMRETVGPDIGVKASGGIRNIKTAACMIEAGANRIGASSGVAILEGFEQLDESSSIFQYPNPCNHCPVKMIDA
ncbi:MAG: deoxyribose-phosphate aldolase, partial [Promethearchaeota archaeon]